MLYHKGQSWFQHYKPLAIISLAILSFLYIVKYVFTKKRSPVTPFNNVFCEISCIYDFPRKLLIVLKLSETNCSRGEAVNLSYRDKQMARWLFPPKHSKACYPSERKKLSLNNLCFLTNQQKKRVDRCTWWLMWPFAISILVQTTV